MKTVEENLNDAMTAWKTAAAGGTFTDLYKAGNDLHQAVEAYVQKAANGDIDAPDFVRTPHYLPEGWLSKVGIVRIEQ